MSEESNDWACDVHAGCWVMRVVNGVNTEENLVECKKWNVVCYSTKHWLAVNRARDTKFKRLNPMVCKKGVVR